jgi:predicted dehydrogenase
LLGDVFFVRIYQRHRLTMPIFDHDQRYFTEMPQLLLYEVGTHLLDVSRYLFGEPQAVYTRLHHISPDVIGEDVQVINLAYENMTMVIHDSWASVPIPDLDRPGFERRWHRRLLEIEGTQGTLVLRPDTSIDFYSDSDEQHWPPAETGMAEAHIAAQQHFIDCLESGAEFETSGEETIRTMALVFACYQSAEQGVVVKPETLIEGSQLAD